MIRKANQFDVLSLVDIHLEALPNDLLPRLGRGFLQNCFYPVVLDSNNACVLVEEEQKEIRSFIVLASNSKALSGEIAKKGFACKIILSIRWDTSIVSDLISYITGFKATFFDAIEIQSESTVEIYLMVTKANCRSKGIGSKLICAALNMLPESNRKCIVKTSSQIAKIFYMKNGFKEVGEEFRKNRRMSILLYTSSVRGCRVDKMLKNTAC